MLAHRSDGYSFIEEDYGHALLEPAIERTAGNTLSRVDNDNFTIRHEQLKGKYINCQRLESCLLFSD